MDKLAGLVDDIHDAVMGYQVCNWNNSLLSCLTHVSDFITTRDV